MVNAVVMIGASYADAEDAVQDALIKAWTDDGQHPIDRLDAWIVVAAWNRTRSGFRRLGAERRARAQLAETDRGRAGGADIDAGLDLMRALAILPRRLREVAVLRYLLQLSTHETAVALGIAEGTVKRALADARRQLANAMTIDDEEVFSDDQDR